MVHRSVLFTLILAAGCATASAAVDKALLALAPANSRVVAEVDVTRARSSQFGQFLISRVGASDRNFEHFLSETGFDMRRDVHDFVFAGPGNANSEGVILARGSFDRNRIRAAARSHGCVRETYRGVELILNSGQTAKSALAFPEPGIAVIANISEVEQIIRSRNTPSSLDSGLSRLIADVGNGNDAWFASLSAGALAAPEVADNRAVASAIRTIQEASGGIRFADPIPVTLRSVTGSSAEAEALSVVLRGMAALARIGHPTDPYLAVLGAAQDLNIAAAGDAVNLSFSISEQDAERIARSALNSDANR